MFTSMNRVLSKDSESREIIAFRKPGSSPTPAGIYKYMVHADRRVGVGSRWEGWIYIDEAGD